MNEFLDNAAKKAKEVFDVACKVTGDVVTSGKQKIDIASIENKLKKLYEQLGKLYMKSRNENNDELVAAIDAKASEIEQMTAELDKAKSENAEFTGKKICNECGAFVEKSAAFCSACGAKFSEND